MKIKKRKKIFLKKLVLLLLILPFVLYNCNDDDQIIPVKENKDTPAFKRTFLDLNRLLDTKKDVALKLQGINQTNTKALKRGQDTDQNLTLNTNVILELSTEFYDTYTVPAFKTEMSEDIMLNYVLTRYPNGAFKQYLMTYYTDHNGVIDDSKTKVETLRGELLLSRGNQCTTFSDIQDVKCTEVYCDTPGHENGGAIGFGCIGSLSKPTGYNCKVTYLNEEDCSSGGGSTGSGTSGNGNNTSGGSTGSGTSGNGNNTSGGSGATSGDNSGSSAGSGSSGVTAPLASSFNDREFTDLVRSLDPLQQLWVQANRNVADQLGQYYISNNYSAQAAETVSKAIDIMDFFKNLTNFWPRNDQEWSVLVELLKSVALDIGLGFLPGYDLVDAVKSYNAGDYWGTALAVAGLISAAAGSTVIKGAFKAGGRMYKVTQVFERIRPFATSLKKLFDSGIKPKITNGVLYLKNRLGRIIASGDDVSRVVTKLVQFSDQIDDTIDVVRNGSRFVEEGTGSYRTVRGHHPLAKKSFEGEAVYDANEAFSVSANSLGGQAVHNAITGKQNSLYSAWKRANPNTRMTISDMADIEVRAMVQAGIPEDVAKGWVVKALENLKQQGVSEIINIPWNGINPGL